MIKHCKSCTCVPKRKKAKKPIKKVVGGIRVYPDGRERCLTKAAWQKRRQEVWVRDGKSCTTCGIFLALSQAEIHHVRKRSLGRDDRRSNLLTLCQQDRRLYNDKVQWSPKR